MTFMITNPNSEAKLTGVGLTDDLPAGLMISIPNGFIGDDGRWHQHGHGWKQQH
jgi:hypothetical protein